MVLHIFGVVCLNRAIIGQFAVQLSANSQNDYRPSIGIKFGQSSE